MAALAGMTGLYPADPQDTADTFDEGVLESKALPLDDDHSEYGSQHLGFSGTVPDASPFASMGTYDAGFTDEYDPGAYPDTRRAGDQTPDTHTAPYPRGIRQYAIETPLGLAEAAQQTEIIHGQEFGGTNRMVLSAPSGYEEETHYTTDRYDAPNETYQATVTQGQLKPSGSMSAGGYGGGNADTVQGYGVLNSIPEFQMGHSIRRVQHDRMPWDFSNTHGEQDVPFMGRHPVYQMPLDGPDSPYFESGDISGAQVPWEGRIGYPTPYVQPSEPTIVPAASDDSGDVYAWGGGF
jgi:hypothetical protein